MPIVSLTRGSETDPNSPGCLNRLLLLLRDHFKWLLGPSFAVRLVLRIRVLDSDGSRNYDAVQTIQLTDLQIFLIRNRDLYGLRYSQGSDYCWRYIATFELLAHAFCPRFSPCVAGSHLSHYCHSRRIGCYVKYTVEGRWGPQWTRHAFGALRHPVICRSLWSEGPER